MKDPQLVPDSAITVEGKNPDPENKDTNVRPNSDKPLESEPNGKPMTVTTVVDPNEPQDLGEIKPKNPKNVDTIKVEIKRTPGAPFEPVSEKDVTDKSKPDKDGKFDPKKPVEFVEGTKVTEVKVVFLPKNPAEPITVQVNIHACFEKISTGK